MPTDNIKEVADKATIIKTALYILFWSTWWIVMYLNQIRRWEKMKIWLFIINTILAWYVWWMVSFVIPIYLIDYNIPIISISWFLAHPILKMVEDNVLDLVFKKLLWEKRRNTTGKKS